VCYRIVTKWLIQKAERLVIIDCEIFVLAEHRLIVERAIMFTRLRTRLFAASVVTVALVIALSSILLAERLYLNTLLDDLTQLHRAANWSRELSHSVQHRSHDISAYMFGRHEQRQEYDHYTSIFTNTVANIQQSIDSAILEADEQEQLDKIKLLGARYDQAAERLFTAVDIYEADRSTVTLVRQNAAWIVADDLADQLDQQSIALYNNTSGDIRTLQGQIDSRNRWVIGLVITLGIVIAVLIALIQMMAARAVGRPLQDLALGVRQFTAGDLDARVTVTRRDEIGQLAVAFNDMAGALQNQTRDLRIQTEQATTARREAELARAAVEEQLATIETQRTAIREMSVPILPLSTTALVVPLVGVLDAERLQTVQEQVLSRLERSAARHLILDVTGIPIVDSPVAQGLIEIAQAARLLGARATLVGIRPEIAQTLVGLGIDLGMLGTRSTLESCLSEYVLRSS